MLNLKALGLNKYLVKNGATCQGRTDDILITSEALYQLS
jgi:hypothetical protein